MCTPKLFISCPMRGLTRKTIKANIEKMHKIAEIIFDQELDVIQCYRPVEIAEGDNQASIWCLGRSIQMISEADYYIGVNTFYGYSHACEIENNVAINYGIQRYCVGLSVLNLPKKDLHYEKVKIK